MRFYWPIAKIDATERMVWGYASTGAEDDQGETVSRDALAAALDDYMRFANIREMHQPSAVGIATEANVDDKGLYVAARIVDADAWEKVVQGVYKGFSIGGRITARDPADRRLITGLRLNEISVVDRPANPEAVFDCWKRAAADPGAGAEVEHADPGYQPDGEKRYPLAGVRHIRAAWAFIHQDDNARRYTPAQLALIRARIIAAWQREIDPAGPPAAHPTAGSGHERTHKDGGDGAALAQRLAAIIAELHELWALLATGDYCDDAELAALAGAARRPPSPSMGEGRVGVTNSDLTDRLAKFADAVVPRLDALQERVDAIARTPLSPQTAARGFLGLTKRDDGGGLPVAGDDIVAALARMSDEEKTLTLIKAAHARPIIPGPR